ncbi:MAG: type II secretion system protein GspM [Xanthomonadales bacterium]|nr:type II secretion system protein GspM [Xanthomonadales bacterium]
MIQIMPDQRNSKATALMLLAIAVLLVYLVFFHWFVLRHKEYAEEISDLREQLGRYQVVASQREALQQRLSSIRSSESDTALFFGQPTFDEAAAAMNSSIGDLVRSQAGDSCVIVSRQPVPSRVQERFEKVTVNVRMRCDAEDFLKVLHGMETGVPLMLVDDVNIIRPRARRVSNAAPQGALDIRFNVSGYLK